MTDQNNGPESLILRHLREIDHKLDQTRADIADLKSRINALEKQTALIVQAWATTNERIDRIEQRLERIERRLNLIEA